MFLLRNGTVPPTDVWGDTAIAWILKLSGSVPFRGRVPHSEGLVTALRRQMKKRSLVNMKNIFTSLA